MTEYSAQEIADLQEAAKRHLWLHFTRMSSYDDAEVPTIVRGYGQYVYDQHGKRYLDGLAGLFVSQIGHGRTEVAEAGARQASRAGLLPAVVLRPPAGHRAGRAAGRHGARRPEPGVLHHQRLRGGRVGLEAGQAVLQAHRPAGRYKVLSRYIAYHGTSMGALAITGLADIKAPFEPLPPGGVRVPEHQLLPGAGVRGRRPGRVRPVGRRRDRAGHPARGPGHGRRGLPRAGAELRRLLPAAARLLPAGPRDLRHLRRAARVRRGDLRVRPARLLLRLRALRLPARHHHLRQGRHLGLRAARRHDRPRPADGAVRHGRGQLPARRHLRRPPGLLRGGHGQPRRVREGGPARPTCAPTRPRSGPPWRS